MTTSSSSVARCRASSRCTPVTSNGDAAGAARMIARAVDAASQEVASLVALLPAQIEIAVASGDIDTAISALGALEGVAAGSDTSVAAAAVACSRGIVLDRQGDLAG